ncbi:flagellar motor protein MotB, partial [Pelotomaculum sp. PtaB.Bin117]
MSRKKQPEPEGKAGMERWLLTYSDLITLLMIFFVVMYALSSINSKK